MRLVLLRPGGLPVLALLLGACAIDDAGAAGDDAGTTNLGPPDAPEGVDTGHREASTKGHDGGHGPADAGHTDAVVDVSTTRDRVAPPMDSPQVVDAPREVAMHPDAHESGVMHDSGTPVDSCSSYCSPPDTIVTTGTPVTVCAESGCGSPSNLTCPAGEVMVGVTGTLFEDSGEAAWYSLGAKCGTLEVGSPSGLAVTTTVNGSSTVVGDGASASAGVDCPSGDAVVGFTGQIGGSGAMFNLTLACAPVSIQYSAPATYTPVVGSPESVGAGGNGGQDDAPSQAQCGSGLAASGLQVVIAGVTFGTSTTHHIPTAVGLDCSNLIAQ